MFSINKYPISKSVVTHKYIDRGFVGRKVKGEWENGNEPNRC